MKKLLEIFAVFLKIGAFTLGGGYAMVPLMQKEIAEKRNWLSEEEFLDIIAIAQSAPGPIAINTSLYVGYKISGMTGAIISSLATALPAYLAILVVAVFFRTIKDLPIVDAIFKGIRPAVAAMIAASVVSLLKSAKGKKYYYIVSFLAALSIVVFNLHPILVIIISALGGIVAMYTIGGED